MVYITCCLFFVSIFSFTFVIAMNVWTIALPLIPIPLEISRFGSVVIDILITITSCSVPLKEYICQLRYRIKGNKLLSDSFFTHNILVKWNRRYFKKSVWHTSSHSIFSRLSSEGFSSMQICPQSFWYFSPSESQILAT